MSIPDEAVEAAAKATYYTSGRNRVMPYSEARTDCMKEAREVLEAAVPHLMAEAWDEGVADMHEEAYRGVVARNPYRPAGGDA